MFGDKNVDSATFAKAVELWGKRGTMDEEVKEAFRQSGLWHLLAIAGLHLGLVGGFVFFTVRGGLALIPPLALRYPIKKIAAVVTLVVLFCYQGNTDQQSRYLV